MLVSNVSRSISSTNFNAQVHCALKLVEEIILHYDAWSKKHKKKSISFCQAGTKEQ